MVGKHTFLAGQPRGHSSCCPPDPSRGCLSPLLLRLHVLSPELGQPRSPRRREEPEGCVPKTMDKPTPEPGRAPRAGAGSHGAPKPEQTSPSRWHQASFPNARCYPQPPAHWCFPVATSSRMLGMTQGPRLSLGARFPPLAQPETWHGRPRTRGRNDPQHPTAAATWLPHASSLTFSSQLLISPAALLFTRANDRRLIGRSRASRSSRQGAGDARSSAVSLGTCRPTRGWIRAIAPALAASSPPITHSPNPLF